MHHPHTAVYTTAYCYMYSSVYLYTTYAQSIIMHFISGRIRTGVYSQRYRGSMQYVYVYVYV